MLSKLRWRATALVLATLFLGSCTRWAPWKDEPIGSEVNLSFKLERNLVELQSVRIDNRPGRFILGSATPRTVVDPTFPVRSRTRLEVGGRESLRLSPVTLDLHGVADAIIGAEAWGSHAITIDYRLGMVSYQKEGIKPDSMTIFRFEGQPAITVTVDGQSVAAVVDTSSPDTLILPTALAPSRGMARVSVAGHDFGAIDVQYAHTSRARIGNRLLSRFLVTIDYGKGVVGLWQDPRQ